MATIYRTSDRINYKIDDIEITIRPLSYGEKMSLNQDMVKAAQGDLTKAMDTVVSSVKLALKDVRGLKNIDGSDYTLQFDESGNVSQESIDDLLNLPHSNKLTAVCSALLNSVPTQILDPNTGLPIEGIEMVVQKKSKK